MRKDKICKPFLRTVRPLIVVMVILVMRFNLGNRHKKWLFSIIGIKKFQSHIIDAVSPISFKINPVVVFIKNITVITMGGKL